MRAMRLITTLTAMLVSLGAAAGAASASIQTTVLSDDSLSPGAVVTQSSNGEIQSVDPQSAGFTSGTTVANGVVYKNVCPGSPTVEAASSTNTPPNALELPFCPPGEFAHEGAMFALHDTADTVTADVGGGPNGGAGQTFQMDAYDAQRNLLYTTGTVAGAGVTSPLSVGTSGLYTIAYVALYTTANVAFGDAFDDLTVHSGGGPPDITLSATPPIGQLGQGATQHYTVSVDRQNGSSGNVTLGISGLPSGVNASFGNQTLTGTTTSTSLTLSASPTQALGTFAVTLTATPAGPSVGSGPKSDTFNLQIVHAFDVLITGTGARLLPCSSATVGVYTRLNGGFEPTAQSPVDLTLSSVPSGITASLQKTPLGPADFTFGDNTQSLTVTRGSGTVTLSRTPFQIVPTDGQLTSDPAKVGIVFLPPTITSVSPAGGKTPQALHPGTTVTVNGTGFCPNSTVQFGADNGPVLADSVNASGTQLTATVPVFAATGPLTVSSGGEIATSPNTFTVDNFRNAEAYSFENFLPNLEFDHMTEAFGYAATHTYIGTPDPLAFTIQKIARAAYRSNSGGACFGFSLSAARLMSGEFSPSEVVSGVGKTFDLPGPPTAQPSPAHNDDFYNWFHGGNDWEQEAYFITWNHVQQLSWDFLDPVLADQALHGAQSDTAATQSVYDELKRVFDHGRFPIMVLSMEHVVTAYNIEGSPPDYYIDVWDSNSPFPNDFLSSRIHVMADGTYSLPDVSQVSGTKFGLAVLDPAWIPRYPTLVGQSPLKKYGFPVSADRRTLGASPAPDAGFVDRIVVGSHGPLDHSNSVKAIPFTLPDSAPRTPMIAIERHSSSPVHLTVKDTHAGDDTHTVLGHGYGEQIDTRSIPGSTDTLVVGSGGATDFSTDAASKPLAVTMIGGSTASREVAAIHTTSYRGGGDAVSFDHGVEFTHRGRRTTFDLTLSGASAHGGVTRYDSGPLTIAAGQTASIAHISWGSLNSAAVTIRIGRRTLVVRNHAGRAPLARITGLTAHRGAHRATKLTISARSGRLPAGAQLAFSWLVKGAKHGTVAHTQLARGGTRSATYVFAAPRAGRYTLAANVSVLLPNGITASASARRLRFRA